MVTSPQAVICPRGGKENKWFWKNVAGSALPLKSDCPEKHRSPIPLYRQTSGAQIWGPWTRLVTFPPSCPEQALLFRGWEARDSVVAFESTEEAEYTTPLILSCPPLCLLTRPGFLQGCQPGLWQSPNQSASSFTPPVNPGRLCVPLIPIYCSDPADGSVTPGPKIKPKCNVLTIIYHTYTLFKVSSYLITHKRNKGNSS